MTLHELFTAAIHHHQAGQLQDAEALYRQAIALDPSVLACRINLAAVLVGMGRLDEGIDATKQALEMAPKSAEALSNLADLYCRKGAWTDAILAARRALTIRADMATAHCSLGVAFQNTGQIAQAIASYRQALAIKPDYYVARQNLGSALFAIGDFPGAAAAYQQCLALQPLAFDVHCNLGNALRAMGRAVDAAAEFRQAISVNPNHLNSHFALGGALADQGDFAGAILSFRRATELNPPDHQPFTNLSNALAATGAAEEALKAFQPALERWPNQAGVVNQFGLYLLMTGRLDEAIAAFRRAIALDAGDYAAVNNLGHALQNRGDIDEAIACYSRAMELRPDQSHPGSNRLMALLMKPDLDAHALLLEHRKWDEKYAQPLKRLIQPSDYDRNPDRPLRIGYVSPDLRDHVVGWNLLSLLANHDRQAFEVYCYASLNNPDSVSERIARQCHAWRNILTAADDQAAEVIRQDKIDILVDLSMHTASNRLLVFARKPAPVQLTYLGYAGTTGMEAIDYRLSDPYLDPPGTDLSVYSEKTIHLPHTYWCYQPGGATPDVAAPPSVKNGFIVFGCLNNFAKVSAAALELWGRLLTALPSSRLVLYCPSKGNWEPVRAKFAAMGIAADRLALISHQSFAGYIGSYAHIDLALDPFPYGGAITTCDSLWMGVPVVTLSGRTAVGRAAESILSNIGLPELVAKAPDEYVQIAMSLANDPQRLASLRLGLRRRMAESPLMDTWQFARDMEAAYRKMWREAK